MDQNMEVTSNEIGEGHPIQGTNVATAKEITKGLVTNWLLWYIIMNVIYYFLSSLLFSSALSLLVQVIIAVILQAVMIICAWIMSTKYTFRNKRIAQRDISVVMKNLIIFSVAVCAINGVYQFVQMEVNFNTAIDTNYELKTKEKMMEQVLSSQEMSDYNQQKSEIIAETKKQMYLNLAIVELISVAVFFGILPLEKKMISKYAVLDNNSATTFSSPALMV